MSIDTSKVDLPEDEVPAVIAGFDGPVIVDLDETLYLQNSTADFLDCAAPGLFAMAALKLLDLARPWRRTGRAARDLWRVRLILLLFPWTLPRWRARCRAYGPALTNAGLLQALRARGQRFTIATAGFGPIVEPLLAAMGCADADVIACRLTHPSDRSGGKAALIEARLGAEALGRALVITDSPDDMDVLQRCARPCLTKWRAAVYRRPFQGVYLPGFYTRFVKRPGPGGFNSTVTTLCFWFVITLTASAFNFRSLLAVPLFFSSFWAIYETGYLDNDRCGQKYETDAVVTPEFRMFRPGYFEVKAWSFALALGAGGILVLGQRLVGEAGFAWLGTLLITSAVFRVYNRLDKTTRVWLYLALQILRESAFLVFTAVNPVGVMACAAHVMSKWQEYIIYRYARTLGVAGWPKTPHRTFRLAVFAVLVGALAVGARSIDAVANWSTLALFLLNLVMARKELAGIVAGARRIDRVVGETSGQLAH